MKIVYAALAAIALTACGGSGAKLHLSNGTEESASQVRAEIRATLNNPGASQTLCGVSGLSTADAYTYLKNLPGATVTSTIDQQSLTAFIQILQDECHRIGH